MTKNDEREVQRKKSTETGSITAICVPEKRSDPRAKSYYVGPEILGKPRLVMLYSGGVRAYQRMPERVAEGGYKSFLLSRYLASSITPRV
jgi:hypothetical protein